MRNQVEYDELMEASRKFAVAIKTFADNVPLEHLDVISLIEDLDQVLGAIEQELKGEA